MKITPHELAIFRKHHDKISSTDILRLISEIEALQKPPAATWRPIATAPHEEGREILALHSPTSDCWIVSWGWSGGWRVKQMPGRDPVNYFPATHWMPLPSVALPEA